MKTYVARVVVIACIYFVFSEPLLSMDEQKIITTTTPIYTDKLAPFAYGDENLRLLSQFIQGHKKNPSTEKFSHKFTSLAEETRYRPALYQQGRSLLLSGNIKDGIDILLQSAAVFNDTYIYLPACMLLCDNLANAAVQEQKNAIVSLLRQMREHGKTDLVLKAIRSSAQKRDWLTIKQLLTDETQLMKDSESYSRKIGQLPLLPEDAYEVAVDLLSENALCDDDQIIPLLLEHASKKVPEAYILRITYHHKGKYGFEKNSDKAIALIIHFCTTISSSSVDHYKQIIRIIQSMGLDNEEAVNKKLFMLLITMYETKYEMVIAPDAELKHEFHHLALVLGSRLWTSERIAQQEFSEKAVKKCSKFLTWLYQVCADAPDQHENLPFLKKMLIIACTSWYPEIMKRHNQNYRENKLDGLEKLLELNTIQPIFMTKRELDTAQLEHAYLLCQKKTTKEKKRAYTILQTYHEQLLSPTTDVLLLCAYEYAVLLTQQDGDEGTRDAVSILSNLTANSSELGYVARRDLCVLLLNQKNYGEAFKQLDYLLEKDTSHQKASRQLHQQTLGLRFEYYKQTKNTKQLSKYLEQLITSSAHILGERELLLMLQKAYHEEKNHSKEQETSCKLKNLSM